MECQYGHPLKVHCIHNFKGIYHHGYHLNANDFELLIDYKFGTIIHGIRRVRVIEKKKFLLHCILDIN